MIFIPAFYWSRAQINKNIQEIVEKKSLIRQGSNLTGTLASLKKEKTEAVRFSQALERLIATRDELVVNFSGWLDREASNYQVGITFSFQGNEVLPNEEGFGQAQFSIRLSGDLSNIVALMRRLERESNQFLLNFDNFDINRGAEGYYVTVVGKVFFK